MAVEFVCSRAEIKAAEYILSKIKAQVDADPLARVIVLVPPQATLMTENYIMRSLGLPGLMGVWVMGPEKLKERILETVFGRARQTIGMPGKSMVLRRLMEEHADRLSVLGACARTQNICSDIAGVLSEFKSMDILPGQIAALRSGKNSTDHKLKDLAFLYEKFEDYMKDRALTGEDRMNIAIDHVKDCRFIAESDVYILDFGLYTAQMTRMVAAIAAAAKNTAITFLDTNPADPDADLFEAARIERAVLQKAVSGGRLVFLPEDRHDSEVAHVSQNLYAYPYARQSKASENVQIVRALNPEQEVAAAAELIARLSAEDGFAMRNIAVVLGNADEYAGIIKEKFTRSNIPYFLNENRSALDNFAARFLLSALRMAGGRLSKEKLLAHIESAFGQSDPQVSLLKNYAYQNISNAYQFEKPFADDAAEQARARCVLPALAFRRKIASGKTAEEKLAALAEYMQETCLEERVSSHMDEFLRLEFLESAEYYEQAFKSIGEVLDQAKIILGGTDLSARELAEVLKSGLESVSIRLIPQGADDVVVGNIGVLRLNDIRALIVLGVNEGKIPNYEEEAGILSPNEKDFIMEEILHRCAGTTIARQKLAVYRMFSLPSEKLILIYHEFSENGQQQPSSLIFRMHEILTIRETHAEAFLGKLLENAMMRAADELKEITDGYTGRSRPYLAALLAREDTGATIQKYERFAAWSHAAGQMDRKIAGDLYGKSVASVSRFETYFSCPFRHYVLYGLKPEVPRESGIESLDVGNFVHCVLDRVSKSLKSSGRSWSGVSDMEMSTLLRENAKAVRETEMKYTLGPKNENTLQIVERELYWALSAIRRQFETSCLEMEETEYHFEMDIAGVRLKGVIDRLDVAKTGEENLFKVVDYKTGEKNWSLQDFAEGLSLQLVVYMLAGLEYFRQRIPDIRPAGADYFTVKLPLLETFDPDGILAQYKMKGLLSLAPEDAKKVYGYDGAGIVSLSLRLKKDGIYHGADTKDVYTREEIGQLLGHAKKLVLRAAGEIESGGIAAKPQPNNRDIPPCAYCDFRSVCLLDEADIPDKKAKKTKDEIMQGIGEGAGQDGR